MRSQVAREILILAQSAAVEALVREAAASLGPVTSLDLSESPAFLASTSAPSLIVIDLAPARFDEAVAVIRLVRNRQPDALLVAVAARRTAPVAFIHPDVQSQLTDVVLLGEEEVVDLIRAHLRDESRTGAHAAALRAVYRVVPRKCRPLARAVIVEDPSCPNLDGAAACLRETRFSIHRAVTRELGMTMCEFVDWCRVVLGAALLEYAEWTVTRAAERSGFRDVRAFRNVVERMIGCLPGALWKRGSTRLAAAAMARDLARRAAAPRPVPRWTTFAARARIVPVSGNGRGTTRSQPGQSAPAPPPPRHVVDHSQGA